jgi:hypothetical protein
MVIWYIFPRFGMLYQEKSGNRAPDADAIAMKVFRCGKQKKIWRKIDEIATEAENERFVKH